MNKGFKKSVAALVVAAAIFAASIVIPAAGQVTGERQTVGFFLDFVLEGT